MFGRRRTGLLRPALFRSRRPAFPAGAFPLFSGRPVRRGRSLPGRARSGWRRPASGHDCARRRNRPWPTGNWLRSFFSVEVSLKMSASRSTALACCLRRTCMLELAMTARPKREEVKSSTSWVMLVMPRLYLRALLVRPEKEIGRILVLHDLARPRRRSGCASCCRSSPCSRCN